MDAIQQNLVAALEGLIEAAKPEKGSILVVGCSTSEVLGDKIGTTGSDEAAEIIFKTIQESAQKYSFYIAAQCCEHLNRAIVIEKEAALCRGLSQVNAIPRPHAGGAFAAAAYRGMTAPFVAEHIQADFGIDIGHTLIGMHLKEVAVPVRVSVTHIGKAPIVLARTRPKYIGGQRAIYDETLM